MRTLPLSHFTTVTIASPTLNRSDFLRVTTSTKHSFAETHADPREQKLNDPSSSFGDGFHLIHFTVQQCFKVPAGQTLSKNS